MTLYLHIGTAKTGTTSIQHTFFNNADYLRREHSINYPSVALNHWAIVLPFVDEQTYRPLRNHILMGLGTKKHFHAMARAYERGLRRDANHYKTHVISAEQLLVADRDSLVRLKALFTELGLDTKIVVYVRHPADRLSSLISQHIKNGTADLKTFEMRDGVTPSLRKYVDVFGKENMIVRRFGSAYFLNGDLIDDFTAVISGVPIEGLKKERLNESLSVPAVMLAEHLFEIAPLESGKRGRDDSLNLSRIAGPKFRAPRYLVERAVDAHRDGLRYLEEEFGIRFDDVDLSTFPEEIAWEFPQEAIASVAAMINEQSLRIGKLTDKLKRRRWDRRLRARFGQWWGAD